MKSKIIQIEAVRESNVAYGFLFALTDDGKIYTTKITEVVSPLGVDWVEVVDRKEAGK